MVIKLILNLQMKIDLIVFLNPAIIQYGHFTQLETDQKLMLVALHCAKMG